MNKAELQKRQQMLSAVPTDQADDFEDIILTPSAPGVDKEKVVYLPISKTVEYSDEDFERATGRPQPFKVYTEDRMESLCKSIADIGVIDPITVRPLPDGTYQVLAGRHRRKASIRIGAETIPAIIRSDISDYQAAMIMLDTNLERRAELSYSEKAYAYRMRMDLQHSRGRRTDLEGGQKVDTLGELGKENKESRRTVAYLIRLTWLIRPLLELVDEGALGFKVAVAISYLSQETQEKLYEEIILTGEKVKQSQINELKVLETYGEAVGATLQMLFDRHDYYGFYLYLVFLYGFVEWQVPERVVLLPALPAALKSYCEGFMKALGKFVSSDGNNDEPEDDEDEIHIVL